MADDKSEPVFQADAKESKDGTLETPNYTGTGFDEKHGHVVVDDQGKLLRARDVDDKKMRKC
jgi:hypothetical protein